MTTLSIDDKIGPNEEEEVNSWCGVKF